MDNALDERIANMLQDMSGNYRIVLHEELINDLSKLISKSGQAEKFLTKFYQRCLILSELGKNAVSNNNFEKLKHLDFEMFSLHIKTEKNIRILYSFDGDTIVMLLCAFHERSGKKKTDYTNYIPIAKQRIKEC